MSTTHHMASHNEGGTLVPASAVRILAALTLLVVGIFIGMMISHRVISAQVTHYGNTQMAGGSVLINVLDDLAPYLATALLTSLGSILLTLAAWIWSRSMSRRHHVPARRDPARDRSELLPGG